MMLDRMEGNAELKSSVQLMLDVEDARTVDVERNGTDWRVLRVR